MQNSEIRQPVQKRSIEKKERIIKAGVNLICKDGYHNTNTAKIAKEAGVSTGIVYQYFKDKHDILIEGIKLYSNSIFFPMLSIPNASFKKDDLTHILKKMINAFVKNHKLSKKAHEEIVAMQHSDPEIAKLFYEYEIMTTEKITNLLLKNDINTENLKEKVHIMIHLIDDLCHETVYFIFSNGFEYRNVVFSNGKRIKIGYIGRQAGGRHVNGERGKIQALPG